MIRALVHRRKWSNAQCAIAAVGLCILLFCITLLFDSSTTKEAVDSGDPSPIDPSTEEEKDLVDLTLLRSPTHKSARCLDGSLPGYHFQRGYGSGSRNWLLHIEGGGWCNTVESCAHRKMTQLGSSNYMERQVRFTGILSSEPSQNPDFYDWNKVKIRYCDGGSFAGNPEGESKIGAELFFRGQLIWEALMDELLSLGMSNAKQAFLTGCSAGGLATLIHCDSFRELLPKDVTVKCLADAGFFLDEKDVLGNYTMRSFYHDVVLLQGLAKSLPKECIARADPYKCMFPQEIVKGMRTPLFLVHPAYDFWQIRNILIPDVSDPSGHWRKCRLNPQHCDPGQAKILEGFRESLLMALNDFQQNKDGGLFVNSCFIHCQTWMPQTWHSPTSPRINNKTIAEWVGDWFFSRGIVKQIDCPGYACNPTCYNMDFSRI